MNDGTYWFDPDPTERTAAIPSGKIDVPSTCGHELGHAIGLSEARDSSTGNLPGYSFLYDEHTTANGSDYYFIGAEAEAAYARCGYRVQCSASSGQNFEESKAGAHAFLRRVKRGQQPVRTRLSRLVHPCR